MGIADDAVEVRAQGWRTLAALHGLIESALERELTSAHDLSVVEFTVLDTLSRQDGWHMRMSQLEDRKLIRRILCADDRRGIYTELTRSGVKLLEAARPTHDRVLEDTIRQAEQTPELAPLVDALHRLPAAVAV